jgi:hypothetical protein
LLDKEIVSSHDVFEECAGNPAPQANAATTQFATPENVASKDTGAEKATGTQTSPSHVQLQATSASIPLNTELSEGKQATPLKSFSISPKSKTLVSSGASASSHSSAAKSEALNPNGTIQKQLPEASQPDTFKLTDSDIEQLHDREGSALFYEHTDKSIGLSYIGRRATYESDNEVEPDKYSFTGLYFKLDEENNESQVLSSGGDREEYENLILRLDNILRIQYHKKMFMFRILLKDAPNYPLYMVFKSAIVFDAFLNFLEHTSLVDVKRVPLAGVGMEKCFQHHKNNLPKKLIK